MDQELTNIDSAVSDPQVMDPITAPDIILGVLSLPLLLWVLMFTVTGSENLFKPARRRRVIMALLVVIEAITTVTLIQIFAY